MYNKLQSRIKELNDEMLSVLIKKASERYNKDMKNEYLKLVYKALIIEMKVRN